MNWRFHPDYDGIVSVLEVPIGSRTFLFIPHPELLEMGYESLVDFDIVCCNERYFELQGYNPAIDSWWVEEIEVTQEEDAREITDPPGSSRGTNQPDAEGGSDLDED